MIWDEECMPEELPQKRDTSLCNNWRGINLLTIPSKVLFSIILSKVKKMVDKKEMRDARAGFKQERSYVDQIATMRLIIEQTIEWQISVYINLTDFQKAFDNVDHHVFWRILRPYGIPNKIIYR
jgi:hypothetical protein